MFNLLAHLWVVVFANTPSPLCNPFLWISYRKLSFCLPNITPPNSPKGFLRGLGPHGGKEWKDKIMGPTLFGLFIYALAAYIGPTKMGLNNMQSVRLFARRKCIYIYILAKSKKRYQYVNII